ncbi:MAG: 50S ribosomal protein L3 [Candidatus Actinomarina sp.]|uniref:Large ribosomal subunit protein uL3 n=1 Tax=Candidatus Actinomarina minuta TaxID=1389454 RepID=S5DST9_9ACTN|nr:ribosomal protein L3 [Candidatus Actinomarina minuta]|tara:strand:+ start:124 stop:756 length:633 start_codon:yes stop_codon:yes gene_type:complete
MNTLIAKKIGMTQIFDENSNSLGVTVLDVSDCRVVQVKNTQKDGYNAVQLTIGSKKKLSKPLESHYKKYKVDPGEILFEVKVNEDTDLNPGQKINVKDFFEVGQKVDITGISKGKGFAGVMKRHNFSGQKASHGVHKVHRAGGSIGNASYPGHVFKGQKMAGRMGNQKSTIQSVTIVGLDEEQNYLLVNGSVPGNKGNIVQVQSAVKVKK